MRRLLPALLLLAACGGSREIEIRVFDLAGEPLLGAYLVATDDTHDGTAHHVFRVRRDTAPFTVVAPGFRPRRIDATDDDMDVTLEPGYAVKLTLPDGLVLPDPPHFLCVELEQTDGDLGRLRRFLPARRRDPRDDWEQNRDAPLAFRTDGRELRVLVHAPGTYAVTWTVEEIKWSREAGSETFMSHGSGPADPTQTLTVKDQDAEQTFPLEIDAKQLGEHVR